MVYFANTEETLPILWRRDFSAFFSKQLIEFGPIPRVFTLLIPCIVEPIYRGSPTISYFEKCRTEFVCWCSATTEDTRRLG
jgi:hypothetical protein